MSSHPRWRTDGRQKYRYHPSSTWWTNDNPNYIGVLYRNVNEWLFRGPDLTQRQLHYSCSLQPIWVAVYKSLKSGVPRTTSAQQVRMFFLGNSVGLCLLQATQLSLLLLVSSPFLRVPLNSSYCLYTLGEGEITSESGQFQGFLEPLCCLVSKINTCLIRMECFTSNNSQAS